MVVIWEFSDFTSKESADPHRASSRPWSTVAPPCQLTRRCSRTSGTWSEMITTEYNRKYRYDALKFFDNILERDYMEFYDNIYIYDTLSYKLYTILAFHIIVGNLKYIVRHFSCC